MIKDWAFKHQKQNECESFPAGVYPASETRGRSSGGWNVILPAGQEGAPGISRTHTRLERLKQHKTPAEWRQSVLKYNSIYFWGALITVGEFRVCFQPMVTFSIGVLNFICISWLMCFHSLLACLFTLTFIAARPSPYFHLFVSVQNDIWSDCLQNPTESSRSTPDELRITHSSPTILNKI